MKNNRHCELDSDLDGTYKEKKNPCVAWRVLGWETEPDSDTGWTGIEERTGRVIARMLGDDSNFAFELDELEKIEREDYCIECGQIGCTHDGFDRNE